MEKIYISDDFIKLGQALKKAGCVESGAEAKEVITEGHVNVNGSVELARGKKIREGDVIEYEGKQILICR